MDVQGFIDHLDRHRQADRVTPLVLHTAKIHISNIAKVECALGNLIRKGADERRVIYETLAHGQPNLHENQRLMQWTLRTSRDTIDPIRNSIKEYCKFCQDPPIGD